MIRTALEQLRSCSRALSRQASGQTRHSPVTRCVPETYSSCAIGGRLLGLPCFAGPVAECEAFRGVSDRFHSGIIERLRVE